MAWSVLGRWLERIDRTDEAEAAFRRGLDLNPSGDVWIDLAGLLWSQRRLAELQALCEVRMARNSNDALAHVFLAKSAFDRGDEAAGLRWAALADERIGRPGWKSAAALKLGVLYLGIPGRLDRAVELLTLATSNGPKRDVNAVNAHMHLAAIAEGRSERIARYHLDLAREGWPKDSPVSFAEAYDDMRKWVADKLEASGDTDRR